MVVVGAEVCAVMTFYLGNHQADFALNFLSLFLEGAPYILLGTLISGFIDVYMPSSLMEKLYIRERAYAYAAMASMETGKGSRPRTFKRFHAILKIAIFGPSARKVSFFG